MKTDPYPPTEGELFKCVMNSIEQFYAVSDWKKHIFIKYLIIKCDCDAKTFWVDLYYPDVVHCVRATHSKE